MISFDYSKSTNKLKIRCEDTDLFSEIREHFSVENPNARFARRYNRFAPSRKYVITGTGTCELGLYWEIRKYLISNQINTDITISTNLKKALKVGIKTELCGGFNFELRDYQSDVVKKASIEIMTAQGSTLEAAESTFKTLIDNMKDFNNFNLESKYALITIQAAIDEAGLKISLQTSG